jgi:hypothetical protein
VEICRRAEFDHELFQNSRFGRETFAAVVSGKLEITLQSTGWESGRRAIASRLTKAEKASAAAGGKTGCTGIFEPVTLS